MTDVMTWELGFPSMLWDHRDAVALADRLRRQIEAAEMEASR